MILNDFCGLGIEKIVENHEKIEILDRLVNFLKFWKNDESVKDFGFLNFFHDFERFLWIGHRENRRKS